MHYHLRHVNTSDQNPNNLNINNKENIFFFEEEYLPDYNFEKLFLDYKKYEKKNDYVSKFKRSLRYIFYFLPRFKSLFRNIFKNKAIKETLFHSTFYQ